MNFDESYRTPHPPEDEANTETDRKLAATILQTIRRRLNAIWDGEVADAETCSPVSESGNSDSAWIHGSKMTKELTDRIVEVVEPIKVILFGSSVRTDLEGEPTFGPDSDVDLLVVVPDGLNKRETARQIYYSLRHFDVAKDIVVANLSELKNPRGVIASALDEGRLLYGRED